MTTAAYLRLENDGTANVKVWDNGRPTVVIGHPGPVPNSVAELKSWANRELRTEGFVLDEFKPLPTLAARSNPDIPYPGMDLRADARFAPLTPAPASAASLQRAPGRSR